MEFLRKLAFALAATTLVLSLYVLLGSLFLGGTLGNETAIKDQLKDSGIYEAAASDIGSKATSDTEQASAQDPIIQAAIKDSVTGTTVSTFAEDVITSTFSWLRGDVETPNFKLHTEQIEPVFISSFTAQLKARLQALPPCPKGVMPSNTDPYSATCWPAGVSIDKEVASQAAEIQAQADKTFSEVKVSSSDIKVEKDGVQQPYYQGLSAFPKYYQWLTLAPRIAAVVTVIMIGLLVLLGRPHEKGLKTASLTFLPIGVILIIAGIFIPQVINQITRPIATALKDSPYKGPVTNLATGLLNNTKPFLITQGVLLTLIGALLMLWYILDSKQRKHNASPRPAANA